MKSIIIFLVLLGCQNSVVNSVNEQRKPELKRENVKKVNLEEEFTETKKEFETKIKELNLDDNISKNLLENFD